MPEARPPGRYANKEEEENVGMSTRSKTVESFLMIFTVDTETVSDMMTVDHKAGKLRP